MKSVFFGALLLSTLIPIGSYGIGKSPAVLPGDGTNRVPTTGETASVAECTGCFGSRVAAWTNTACVTINETGAGIQTGSCTGSREPCNETPCDLSGDFTITINDNPNCVVFRRARINNTCVPGTTTYAPGDTDTISYDGQTLDCNTQIFELLYLNNPGNNCPLNAAAGWSFTCSVCKLVH